MEEYQTINRYDRQYGSMRDVGVTAKPVTVQYVDPAGRAETYIVETIRVVEAVRNNDNGDHLFVQCVDEKQAVTRLALPPKVVKAINSQLRKLDRLSERASKQRRSEVARAAALARMERGEKPAFLVKKNSA